MVIIIELIYMYVKEIYVKYVINIFYNINEFFEIYFWLIIVRCN